MFATANKDGGARSIFFITQVYPTLPMTLADNGSVGDITDLSPFAKRSAFCKRTMPFIVTNRKQNICWFEHSSGVLDICHCTEVH